MSRYVSGYTEAKIDGKWYCIDFFQYDMTGQIQHIPCIEGQSTIYYTLRDDCNIEHISVPTDLSDQVRAACTGDEGRLIGEDETSWNPWHMVKGSWFASVDLRQPEYCGFFPRQAVVDYLCNPGKNDINEDDMLFPEEYHELSDEEKKAYQYFEYTPAGGHRAILRDFKQAVTDRVSAWNEEIGWKKGNQRISLSDVRVLLIME